VNALWMGQALADAMGGRPFGTLPPAVGGISIDSRSLAPGDAFFAIKGDKLDGHDFATAAIKAGAGVLVIAEGKLPSLGRLTTPLIVVDDVLKGLEKLGAASRARTTAKVIAVTGSAGKTTTKEALRHALQAVGRVHASDKSFNNHWGVPLTLARMPADTDYAVFEIGMNHPDEIRPLVKLVRPHIAIVTLIAAAHLGHFKNLDEIAAAKAEIFEGIEPGGAAILNRDDQRFKLLAKLARKAGVKQICGFGEEAKSNFRLLTSDIRGDHSAIRAQIAGVEVQATIGAPGRHMIQNVLAVLGAAKLAGADLAPVAAALATLSPEEGRGQRHSLSHSGGAFTLIDESYNANPASMRAAIGLLDATAPGEGGRRIAVLGDMLELGDHAPRLHAELANVLAHTKTDIVLLGGPHMKSLFKALDGELPAEYRAGADELKQVLLSLVRPGDVVMIKSSKGIGFSKLVAALRAEFPTVGGASHAA
jgi:UDP-N-acetylmuramoyl-tripeptide--D-alanyl-D-alanine ligase